ncbi:hypothetical protein [Clostridium sp.]
MQKFEDYKFANMTEEEKNRITDLEQTMAKGDNKNVILIAYENKNKVQG